MDPGADIRMATPRNSLPDAAHECPRVLPKRPRAAGSLRARDSECSSLEALDGDRLRIPSFPQPVRHDCAAQIKKFPVHRAHAGVVLPPSAATLCRPSRALHVAARPKVAAVASVTRKSALQRRLSTTSTTASSDCIDDATDSNDLVDWKSDSPRQPSSGVTPALVLQRYRSQLAPYEQSEILNFSRVYFWGRSLKHKSAYSANHFKGNNYGFDDEKGNFRVAHGDHLAYRYEIVSSLGNGSFGQVLRCLDHHKRQMVAVKVIKNKKKFHEQARTEIEILRTLRNCEDLGSRSVRMIDYFSFRNHLCIVFELLSANLYEVIRSRNYRGLTMAVVRSFATQLLESLRVLGKLRVVHCDLKPENILLRSADKTHVAVIDFGSSCFEGRAAMAYIQSRFYRSPEVLLGLPYGAPIDIWSFGCILMELITGYPLFPGENEQDQFSLIMQFLGPPPSSMVDASPKRGLFFEGRGLRLAPFETQRPSKQTPNTTIQYGLSQCPKFRDFIQKCLSWHPEDRLTPSNALAHPWVWEGRRRRPPPPT